LTGLFDFMFFQPPRKRWTKPTRAPGFPLLLGPENVASCIGCGCLVLIVIWPTGLRWVLDPGLGDRRLIRSLMPAGTIERQGFGFGWRVLHECPPIEDCALEHWLRAQEQGRGGAS
jgi:hypothetical protein